MKWLWAMLLLLLSAPLLPAQARAQPGDVDRARQLFRAGAAAYTSGNFVAAIQAFEQAHAITPRDGLLFSLAQAHRRQYFADKARKRSHLDEAIAYYRRYLERVQEGGRRVDATTALEELEALVERLEPAQPLDPEDESPAPPPEQPRPKATRVMVTSPTPRALISLDGTTPQKSPLIAEVTPGLHSIEVRAPGHEPIKEQIRAIQSDLVPRHITLDPSPAVIVLSAPSGVDVALDERPVTGLGTTTRITLAPGEHRVVVTSTGHEPFVRQLDLEPASTTSVVAELPLTAQRYGAYGLLGGAGATVLAGVLMAVIAVGHENDAAAILDKRDSGDISVDDANSYTDAVSARDDFRIVAGVVLGSGIALAAAGVLLFLFDDPVVVPAASKSPDAGEDPGVELDLTVGESMVGASLRVKM